jgi:16S rRNA C1402 (ribose-2'-O) methylase RsmI
LSENLELNKTWQFSFEGYLKEKEKEKKKKNAGIDRRNKSASKKDKKNRCYNKS